MIKFTKEEDIKTLFAPIFRLISLATDEDFNFDENPLLGLVELHHELYQETMPGNYWSSPLEFNEQDIPDASEETEEVEEDVQYEDEEDEDTQTFFDLIDEETDEIEEEDEDENEEDEEDEDKNLEDNHQ